MAALEETKAVNAADVDPAGIMTETGTVILGLVLAIATAIPLLEAAWLRVTEQLLEPPAVTMLGVQVNEDKTD